MDTAKSTQLVTASLTHPNDHYELMSNLTMKVPFHSAACILINEVTYMMSNEKKKMNKKLI